MINLSSIVAIARKIDLSGMKAISQQLEPTAQFADQIGENVTQVVKPVCEKVKNTTDKCQNSQPTDSPQIQTLDIEQTLHPTTDHALFTDDYDHDIVSTHHQLEQKNNQLKAENETLKSQTPR